MLKKPKPCLLLMSFSVLSVLMGAQEDNQVWLWTCTGGHC